MKALVIGSPISHSLSPVIFNFLATSQERNLFYGRKEVTLTAVKEFVETCKKSQEYIGFNVTLPLKETIPQLVDQVSDEVKATGAVNVMHFDRELKGYNTDVIGIEKTLKRNQFSPIEAHSLIWGAGGSAKSVAYILGKLKVKTVFIYNRSARGEELASSFVKLFPETQFKFISSLSEIEKVSLSLMVNTTPLGMTGKESGHDYFAEAKSLTFAPGALAFDLIYTPAKTDFMKVANELGLRNVGGLGMLIDQALATWKIWFGEIKSEEKEFKELELLLKGVLKLKALNAPLYLTGFMGSGKSTVGKVLAELTGRELFESDLLIEAEASQKIPEIFASKGEEGFRDLESQVLSDPKKFENGIVSLGGGALNRSQNLKQILNSGILVYLESDERVLAERIVAQEKIQPRPLLAGLQGEELIHKIKVMLKPRLENYQKAQMTLPTANLSPQEICFLLLKNLGSRDE